MSPRLLAVPLAALLTPSCQTTPATPSIEESDRLVGVHTLQLNEGVTPEQFEAFVAGPFAEFWAAPIGGLQLGVAKCDRGANLGGYELAFFFDSVARRNAFFPTPTETTALWEEEMEPRVGPVMEQLFGLCSSVGYTDYAILCSTNVPTDDAGNTFVYGVHEVELRDGIGTDEFEAFVRGPYATAWKDEIAGLGRAVLRGERGNNVGGYRVVFRFRPHTLRDRYVPNPTTLSDEYKAQVEPLLPATIDEQFWGMAGTTGFSDWVTLQR